MTKVIPVEINTYEYHEIVKHEVVNIPVEVVQLPNHMGNKDNSGITQWLKDRHGYVNIQARTLSKFYPKAPVLSV